MIISVFDRVKNIAGKLENAGYQHFFLITQCFQTTSFPGSSKVRIMWSRVQEFADDNFKSDESVRMFSKLVENTGKRKNYLFL